MSIRKVVPYTEKEIMEMCDVESLFPDIPLNENISLDECLMDAINDNEDVILYSIYLKNKDKINIK